VKNTKEMTMKLYTTDHSEMMEISKIEAEDSKLLVTGTIMGAMPVQVVLTGAEMRKAFPLLSAKVVLTGFRMLFSK
jgi:hypothetical protein